MKKEKNSQLATAQEYTSIVFDRIDPPLRQEINVAIIERRPPTFKEVHEKFKLIDRGINYHAFYRYARRIRAEAAYVQTLGASLAPEADLPRLLPRALAQRLLEALAFENPSPRAVQRMTESYRASVAALANVSRHRLLHPRNARETAEDDKFFDDLSAIVKEYRHVVALEERRMLGIEDDHTHDGAPDSEPPRPRGDG